jgi:hypothetical protein
VRSPWGIYIVAALSTVYSVLTIAYTTRTAGHFWSDVFSTVLLIGAIGLFLKRSWGRLPIYVFSIVVVPTWIVYTILLIRKAGWPYYATTLQSILGLVPGVLLCSGCVIACWVVHRYFRERPDPLTVATLG